MKTYDQRMQVCPKCAGTAISGPRHEYGMRFEYDYILDEVLWWTCETCGYRDDTWCKDFEEQLARKKEQAKKWEDARAAVRLGVQGVSAAGAGPALAEGVRPRPWWRRWSCLGD